MNVSLAIKGLWSLEAIFRNEECDSLATSSISMEGNTDPLLAEAIAMKKDMKMLSLSRMLCLKCIVKVWQR